MIFINSKFISNFLLKCSEIQKEAQEVLRFKNGLSDLSKDLIEIAKIIQEAKASIDSIYKTIDSINANYPKEIADKTTTLIDNLEIVTDVTVLCDLFQKQTKIPFDGINTYSKRFESIGVTNFDIKNLAQMFKAFLIAISTSFNYIYQYFFHLMSLLCRDLPNYKNILLTSGIPSTIFEFHKKTKINIKNIKPLIQKLTEPREMLTQNFLCVFDCLYMGYDTFNNKIIFYQNMLEDLSKNKQAQKEIENIWQEELQDNIKINAKTNTQHTPTSIVTKTQTQEDKKKINILKNIISGFNKNVETHKEDFYNRSLKESLGFLEPQNNKEKIKYLLSLYLQDIGLFINQDMFENFYEKNLHLVLGDRNILELLQDLLKLLTTEQDFKIMNVVKKMEQELDAYLKKNNQNTEKEDIYSCLYFFTLENNLEKLRIELKINQEIYKKDIDAFLNRIIQDYNTNAISITNTKQLAKMTQYLKSKQNHQNLYQKINDLNIRINNENNKPKKIDILLNKNHDQNKLNKNHDQNKLNKNHDPNKLNKNHDPNKLNKNHNQIKLSENINQNKLSENINQNKLSENINQNKLSENINQIKLSENINQNKLSENINQNKLSENNDQIKLSNINQKKLSKNNDQIKLSKNNDQIKLSENIHQNKLSENNYSAKNYKNITIKIIAPVSLSLLICAYC